MNYKVIPVDKFKKEAKRLIKKYASLKDELAELGQILSEKPDYGTPLGNDIYKIRISIKSKGKGKSGGARIITYLVSAQKEIYLLTIYDKSEFDTINVATLKKIIIAIQPEK
ncbi:MAG TPA: addiction module toxin RelE [Chitinophagales bacterium]|nr:addiction module toxin RelE [Chitinophagales bacterium]